MIFGIIALIICTIMTFQEELETKNKDVFISTSSSVLTTTISHVLQTMNISSMKSAEQ